MLGRAILVTVLLGIVMLSSVPAPASSLGPHACDEPLNLPAIGPACVVPGGYDVVLSDGSSLFIHGVDPPARAAPHSLAVAPPATPVACVDASQPHARVVYAYPRDFTDTSTQDRVVIVAAVEQANAIVAASAAKFGVVTRLKVLCDANGLPRVDVARLPTRSFEATVSSLFDDVRNAGFGGELEKVWIFYDANVASCNCGGWSNIPGGDWASPSNPNNYGWTYSVTLMGEFGSTWPLYETALHELTHAMGGVQNSAPHTTGGYHCWDGVDIMCYADGGPQQTQQLVCAGRRVPAFSSAYDCNNDDYFHPAPAPGSYLATHWNVGAAYNRFLARG